MSDPDAPEEAADGGDWQFSLADLEEREREAEEAEERRSESLEPGDPSLENVLFVVLGALIALFILSRLFIA